MINNRTYNVNQDFPMTEDIFNKVIAVEKELLDALKGKKLVIKSAEEIMIPASSEILDHAASGNGSSIKL